MSLGTVNLLTTLFLCGKGLRWALMHEAVSFLFSQELPYHSRKPPTCLSFIRCTKEKVFLRNEFISKFQKGFH